MEMGEGPTSVRQIPGPDNPLGRIKFAFPNKYDIYLHDTNQKALFAKPDRDSSHGCIRVEKPMDLAHYLMQDDPQWSGGQLEAAIATGENRDVPLKRPVPVYILYFTAQVRPDGDLEFYEDIYNIDHEQEAAWEAAGSRPPGRLEPGPSGRGQEEEAEQGEPGGEPANVSPEGDAADAPVRTGAKAADTGHDLQQEPAEKPGPGR
jgi:hypothetical protein